jgi:nucleotide-binding universal stress UspA family protein
LSDMTAAGVRASTRTLESHNPAASIVHLGEQLVADLIITGTHARRGLRRAILGSCAEGIIRSASCPVLTLGPNVKPSPKGPLSFHTVVFATDFSSDTAMEAAVALSFAKDSLSRVIPCHVLDHPGKNILETFHEEQKFEEALRSLVPRSAYEWISPERIVPSGPAAQEILNVARKFSADLIVLGAKQSGSWFTHLVDGTVGKVLAAAECPVMTVCGREFATNYLSADVKENCAHDVHCRAKISSSEETKASVRSILLCIDNLAGRT